MPPDRARNAQPAAAALITAFAMAALAAGLAACQHADAPPPAAPKGPTPCERASDSMVGAMLARLPASDEPTEQADALRNLIRERCEQDHWSAEATRCLIAMQKLEDAAPCAPLMTDEQQSALVRDEAAKFGGSPGGPAGGPGAAAAGAADDAAGSAAGAAGGAAGSAAVPAPDKP